MKLVGFGHSHILTLQFAAAQWKNEFDSIGVEISTNWLGDERFLEYRVHSSDKGIEGFDFGDEVKNQISGIDPAKDIVFSCFGGNAHNVLGLVRHPKPFDVRLEDDLFIHDVENDEVIPIGIVEEVMQAQGGFPETVWCLRALRNYHKGKLFHCESPPPIYDEEYLIKHAGVFSEMFEKNGVTHSSLRCKLWRIHSRLIRKECEALDINFIPTPSKFLSDTGFLTEDGLAQDTTHASKEFGRAVLHQLVDKSTLL